MEKKGPIGYLVEDALKNKEEFESSRENSAEISSQKNNSIENSLQEKKQISSNKKPDFVKWFSEINKNSGKFSGGKGANLGEIYNLGISVPPGFVVTAQAYDYFIEKSGLNERMEKMLEETDNEDTKSLEEVTKRIRDLIINSSFPVELENEILEAYEILGASNLEKVEGSALDILNNASEPIFVAVRSSATTEDLAEASFAGQQDSFLNIKGERNLIEHIKKCFASLFTSRAVYYRKRKGFKFEEASLAVVIQKMVDSYKSGVIFSKDPSYNNENIIMEAVWGLGEGIVSGRITPDKYVVSKEFDILDKKISNKKIAITRDSEGNSKIVQLREDKSNAQVLQNHEIKKLSEIALKLEEHYKKPQDIEFAIENEEIYIVQTRPITTMEKRLEKSELKEIQGELILSGLAASPGIGTGKAKIIENLNDLSKIKKGDILVTKMTNPDMVVTMQKCSAIITDEGGLTAHAAIISREMGIPCIVGTGEATQKLVDGQEITIDGYSGKVYKGKIDGVISEKKEILPVTAKTKTDIKVIVDLPTFAERASLTGIKKVGLTRIEGIIAESGKHPLFFLNQNKIQDYEEIIFKGIKEISDYFEEIWVRTSDIRTDEFSNLEGAPKEKEANPMLGMHGIRFGLKNPEILKAEIKALRRVGNTGKKIGILLPQIISEKEVSEVKKILKELEIYNMKVGIMIETPASIQIIKELCEEKIDFISFGTNDLTQYMLAIDRGNEELQEIYNEMHPSIIRQIEYVIRVCKRYNVETSICGQSGSKKEMVKFLVDKEIDSISVNADVAKEISDYVLELEKEKYINEQPRQYQPEKNKENQPEEIQDKSGKIEEENQQEEIQNKSENIKEENQQEEIQNKSPEEPIINGANPEKNKEEGLDIY
jgi:pyruvate, water dikinase